MKIEALLDTPAILANQATIAHLLTRFTAGECPGGRERPIAFAAVIDRSGSMAGPPLEAAKEAARIAVKNLRPDDLFSLVVFDHEAQTVIPLQKPRNKGAMMALIDQITTGGCTNLTAGWMLGRDELLKADSSVPRRLLLLSDGQLNVGVIDPARVRQVVSNGLESAGIRTACLGFGDEYDEELLADLSGATNGAFYDANSPEKLPGIFAAELEGLQAIAVQNLRLRIRRLDFCEAFVTLADYPVVNLPDGRLEIAIGDLVSEEERTLVVHLQVLPIPLLPDGTPAATLEGEALLELEAIYDEVSASEIASRTWKQTIRVLAVQDPADVVTNGDVIPWVAQQRAGLAVDEAMRQTRLGDSVNARQGLRTELDTLDTFGDSDVVEEARVFLRRSLSQLEEDPDLSPAAMKPLIYASKSRRRMSSRQHWTGEGQAPSFIKRKPQNPSSGGRPKPSEQTSTNPTNTEIPDDVR